MKNKSLVLAAMLATCITSFAFAAPQTQWNKGETQIDLGLWNAKAESGGSTGSKWNVNGGATYGLTDQWAVQYEYSGLKTKHDDTTGNSQEINAVYSLNKNVAVYGGWNRIKNSFNNVGSDESASNYNCTNNVLQLGVIAKKSIGNNFDVYAKGALGTKKTSLWEAGINYAVSKNLDVNAGYRYVNTEINDDINLTYKGAIIGASYRLGSGK